MRHVVLLLILSYLPLLETATAAEGSQGTVAQAVTLPTSAVLSAYDALRVALLADDDTAARAAARSLVDAAAADVLLRGRAQVAADAPDIQARRVAFTEVSRILVQGLALPGAPRVFVYFCPMFDGFAYWVQPKRGIANPYMGGAMPACGEEVAFKVALKAAEKAP